MQNPYEYENMEYGENMQNFLQKSCLEF